MANGTPETDREWLIQIASDVKHIKTSQDEKFDITFTKLNNHGKRLSDVEVQQGKVTGIFKLKDEKISSLEDDVKELPSAPKIIAWMAILITIITGLGVYASSLVK